MPGLPQTVKPLRLFASAVGLSLLTVLMSTAPASAQSFDCQKAYYPDEKTICQDSRLGQLDRNLASVYGDWVGKLPKEQREEIEGNETLFVQARRRCGRGRSCIEQSYRNRIEEIQEAIAQQNPDRHQRGVPDRAGASDLHPRSSTASDGEPPGRDLHPSKQATGAVANLPEPSERGTEPRAKNSGVNPPRPDATRANPVLPVPNTPTRGEAAEALRSAEREERAEKEAPKQHHRARVQPTSSSPPEREAPSSGVTKEHAKREPSPYETNAATVQPPAKHHAPNRTSTTANTTPPKEQTPAPRQPGGQTGSTGWVNPPPEP